MDDPTRVSRLLMESAATLAHATNARAIIAYIDALPDVEAVPPRMIVAVRDKQDRKRVENLAEPPISVIQVPKVTLSRIGQVKLAAIIALSQGLIDLGSNVVFLTGPYRAMVDSLVVMTPGAEYELLEMTDQPELDATVRRAVFYRVLDLALRLGEHGREGRRVGSLLVLGDTENVLSHGEQMILNPFRGYESHERNLLDESMTETILEYSSLDGAFVIKRNGIVETAGMRLKVGSSEGLPSGLGARHAAAAGITSATRSVAITVSQSDGVVRVWRAGKMLASFDPSGR